MKKKGFLFPVTIIIAMRNASSTVIKTLDSVMKQKYPVKEIIIIDNASTDQSLEVVKSYKKKEKRIPIRLICQKINQGVGASYNLGVKLAKTDYVVFLHSDSVIPSSNELNLLTKPMRKNNEIIASCSRNTLPERIWLKYPFWEKCLFAPSVGQSIPALNGKFDCINKKAYLSIGGSDTVNYGHNIGVGSDDADLAYRLEKVGKLSHSQARIIHLHYLKNDYSIWDWFENRKLLARSYGRLMRLHSQSLRRGAWRLLLKPILVLLSLIPKLFPLNLAFFLLFSLVYMRKMYITPSSLKDPRIILLPFISIFLIYYETFWMIESYIFLTKENKK